MLGAYNTQRNELLMVTFQIPLQVKICFWGEKRIFQSISNKKIFFFFWNFQLCHRSEMFFYKRTFLGVFMPKYFFHSSPPFWPCTHAKCCLLSSCCWERERLCVSGAPPSLQLLSASLALYCGRPGRIPPTVPNTPLKHLIAVPWSIS